ncbi:MAG: phytoene desaturase family protein [Candidatus Saccharimonadales bacterium]
MSYKSAIIIGAGFGGLGSAALLAQQGYQVTVLEKNEQVGGRASILEVDGFRFDTGPSWYLMPDVFERFFQQLGENIGDYVELVKLQPSYRVFYKDLDQQIDLWGDIKRDALTFDSIEPGAGKQLEKYLARSKYVYQTAMSEFLYKNYDNVSDFLSIKLAREARKLSLFSTMDRYVRRFFSDPRLQHIMEYPLVFLGSSPFNAPALYNLMSHVDFNQGVFYPKGGIYEVTKALAKVADKQGVKTVTNATVERILVENSRAVGVMVNGKELRADLVVSNADPHFTETQLLSPQHRDHSARYWEKRVMAPSALLMYLGVKGTLPALSHHNLLFSQDWKQNFAEIFDQPQFPSDPSLYVCKPSQTDKTVAPSGHENMFVLVPVAAGLEYTSAELEKYADGILSMMEQEMKLPDLRKNIVYKKLFCVKDFEQRFNSFKGTGLGLAHTLRQTAIFRPRNVSRKVKGLYYVGANVHPGIGLPVCLISAQLLMKRLDKLQASS